MTRSFRFAPLILSMASAAAAGSLLVLDVTAASAYDQSISASKVLLKRAPSGKESLQFISKDPTWLYPMAGSDQDPSIGGATVELFSPVGPVHVTFDLPPGLGKPGWSVKEFYPAYYKFQNPAAPDAFSSVKLGFFKADKQIKIVAKSIGLPLAGPQGSIGVRISTGVLRNCALFDAARSTIVSDTADKFIAKNAVAAPALPDCSSQSLGGSMCGNGMQEGDEICDGSDDAACPYLCKPDCTCAPPSCGDNHKNQASEECDGTDDTACPGECQPSCVCLGVCGDGIVNQPSEGCDGEWCSQPFLGCRAPGTPDECTCCHPSGGGYFCDTIGCCNPDQTCISGGPHGTSECCYSSPGHACAGNYECCADFGLACGSGGVCCGSPGAYCTTAADCCNGGCGNVLAGHCDP